MYWIQDRIINIMKLNIKNRLILLQILPSQGSLSEMVEIMDLAKLVKLSDEEKELIAYTENNGNITWNSDKDPNKDIPLNSDKIKILKEVINKLDSEKKISIAMLDLALEINKL